MSNQKIASRPTTPMPEDTGSPSSPTPSPAPNVGSQHHPFHEPSSSSSRAFGARHRSLGSSTRSEVERAVSEDDALNEAIARLDVSDPGARRAGSQSAKPQPKEPSRMLPGPPHHRAQSLDSFQHTRSRPRFDGSQFVHGGRYLGELEEGPSGHEQERQAYRDEGEEPEEQEEEEEEEEEVHEEYDEEEQHTGIRGEPQACLFVASLAASKTDAQLVESVTEHFKKWGNLLHVKVLKDWMQRPYSFVQFENVQDAQRAMAEAQNTVVDGRHIRIEQARVNRTLFILRFGRTTTEQELEDVLQQYGRLEDVSIFQDLGPARNRRYAFARFAYRDDAIKAYVSLRSTSKWTVEWAPNLSTQNQIEKESVFVGQLNPDLVTEEALRIRFSTYGEIRHINLVKKAKSSSLRPSAFAFIEFESEQAANKAIAHEATFFLGTNIRVQHRETNEYRIQRQNAALQASRNLSLPQAMGGTQTMMSPSVMAPPEYSSQYSPFRRPNIGQPEFYPQYYHYAPVAPGMPMPVPGFVARTKAAVGPGMYAQQGGVTRCPTLQDMGQGYFQPAPAQFNAPATTGTQNVGSDMGQYGATQEPGMQPLTSQQGYEYAGYYQVPEGYCYNPSGLPSYYMYGQGQGMPAVPAGGQPNPAPVVHPIPVASVPPTSPTGLPVWYMAAPRPAGGGQMRRPGQDASARTSTGGAHPPIQIQPPPGVGASLARPLPPSNNASAASTDDGRGQAHKAA